MEIIDKEIREIRLTEDELILIANALNEVCNGIDIPEFETRLGGTIEDAKTLKKNLDLLF